MFRQIEQGFNLEVASFGERNSRILIFRVGDVDSWEQVADKRVLLVGGEPVKRELRRLLSEHGRPSLNQRIPGGISGSVHTALRRHVGS